MAESNRCRRETTPEVTTSRVEMKLSAESDKVIGQHLTKIQEPNENGCSFIHDVIYGDIRLSIEAWAIARSPEFERLGNISQLGTAWFVFPTAQHKRYEHCVGVAYLSRRVGEFLAASQPELNITSKQIRWLEIAGLCHDIGHGPFSHTFDSAFCSGDTEIEARGESSDRPKSDSKGALYPKHEQRSKIIARMVMERHPSLFDEEDIAWVEWLIEPDGLPASYPEYTFLGQIVSNVENGMDTDKMDYVVRDGLYLGCRRQTSWDILGMLSRTRIIGEHWCFHVSDAKTIEQISHKRQEFHQNFYGHPIVIEVEQMLNDILWAADPFMRFRTSLKDPKAFCRFDDQLIQEILLLPESEDERVEYAKSLCSSFIARRMWWKYHSMVREKSTKTNENPSIPAYVRHHKVHFFSLNRNQIDWLTHGTKIIARKWIIPYNRQAPHRALPYVPFYEGNGTNQSDLRYLFADYPSAETEGTYFHILAKKTDVEFTRSVYGESTFEKDSLNEKKENQ
jgi:HD superfamily phosphohydrolase